MPYKPTQEQQQEAAGQITRPVRRHLVQVYLTLAAMVGIAALGATHLGTHGDGAGLIEAGGVAGSLMGIRYLQRDSLWRWALLGTYALLSGMSLTALLSVHLAWDPSGALLLSALSATVFVFLGFSASALLAPRRSMLYVGGLAGSIVGLLLWSALANLFLRSPALMSAELYLGLIAFSGFVVFDTQHIVERASAGWHDVPGHAVDLFMDLFALFVRLAIIFLKKDQERNQRKRRDSDDERGGRRGGRRVVF